MGFWARNDLSAPELVFAVDCFVLGKYASAYSQGNDAVKLRGCRAS